MDDFLIRHAAQSRMSQNGRHSPSNCASAIFFPTVCQAPSEYLYLTLLATTALIPFLVVRVVYALLGIFSTGTNATKWDPLVGNVAAFLVMHSVMEYVVVILYLVLGFILPPVRRTEAAAERRDVPGQAGGDVEVGPWK